MTKNEFAKLVGDAKGSLAYQNYLDVREAVWRMIENCPREAAPSKYWQEEISGFDYMFDASPLIMQKLRHHSYHLTGLYDYAYRKHHSRNAVKFSERLKLLKSLDRNNLLVSESPLLGGFGHEINGMLFNVDTVKFYESLIVLDKSGLLDQFKKTNGKKFVLEIGSGWGGFAYQFKTLFPKVIYALVDFPETMLFSATYLKTLFPEKKVFLSDGSRASISNLKIENYDFIFMPHYAWGGWNFRAPDLILNQASFQEMTTAQADKYIKEAKKWGVPNIYSWNRDHSPNNPELSAVSSILSKYYNIKEIEMPLPKSGALGIRNVLRQLIGQKQGHSDRDYRHLLGYL